MWSKPASTNCWATSRWRATSGPQANCWRICSVVTLRVAASKLTGLNSSDITFQPVSAQRVFSHTARAALSASGAQASGTSA